MEGNRVVCALRCARNSGEALRQRLEGAEIYGQVSKVY